MKISVALCTYNGARYLTEQLASISQQTRPPDELVICDDGSNDGTVDIASAFQTRSSFPVTIRQNPTNLGFIKNFEQALGLCTGDLIFLADQDDVWYPDKVAHMVAYFERDDTLAVLFGNADIIDQTGRRRGHTLFQSVGFAAGDLDHSRGGLFRQLLRSSFTTGATMALRRTFLAVAMPIPATIEHDRWLAWMAASRGVLGYVKEPLMSYRQHGGNQIGVTDPDIFSKVEAARRSKDAGYSSRIEQLKVLLEGVPTLETKDLVADQIAWLTYRQTLSPSLLTRIPAVGKRCLDGTYFTLGNGWRSVLKDLLMR